MRFPHERVTVITDCTAEEPLGPEDLRRRTVRGDVESGNLPGNVEKASLIRPVSENAARGLVRSSAEN